MCVRSWSFWTWWNLVGSAWSARNQQRLYRASIVLSGRIVRALCNNDTICMELSFRLIHTPSIRSKLFIILNVNIVVRKVRFSRDDSLFGIISRSCSSLISVYLHTPFHGDIRRDWWVTREDDGKAFITGLNARIFEDGVRRQMGDLSWQTQIAYNY